MDQLVGIFQAILDDFVDTLDAVPQLNAKRQLALYIDIYSTPAEKHYFVNLGQAVKDILRNNVDHRYKFTNTKSNSTENAKKRSKMLCRSVMKL